MGAGPGAESFDEGAGLGLGVGLAGAGLLGIAGVLGWDEVGELGRGSWAGLGWEGAGVL